MNPAEAAVLLSAISANDNREVTEAGARALAAALPDIDLSDSLEFLPTFYRTATRDTKNWIYPGDVVTGVRELHGKRRESIARDAETKAIESAQHRAITDGSEPVELSDADIERIGFTARIKSRMAWDAEHLPECTICREEREAAHRQRSNTEAWGR